MEALLQLLDFSSAYLFWQLDNIVFLIDYGMSLFVNTGNHTTPNKTPLENVGSKDGHNIYL